ncbi:MAG: hypothetical protein ACODAC_07390, partial [Pseudomonadota bacterium]
EQAAQAVREDYQRKLAQIEQRPKAAERAFKASKTARKQAKRRVDAHERKVSEMYEKCGCYWDKLCLVSQPSGLSAAEMRAAERREERTRKACREYASTRDPDRKAKLRRKFDEIDAEYKAKRKALARERRAAERAREREWARQQRERAQEVREREARLLAQKQEQIEEKRESCSKWVNKSGAYPCGCGPFVSQQRRDQMQYCMK